MKCRSVACIWSDTPPFQRVTAVTAIDQPPTFYTGGSNGSIIWWNLSDSNSKPEIKQVGMLCGHAAPITDLAVCSPVTVLEENANYSSNLVVNSSNNCGALISACTDGFLCVWSRSSGHCRCRRKLPPWVGSPSMVRTLPSKTRYVCIGCCFMDNVLLSDHNSVDSTEGSEGLLDKESQRRKPSKCTIVIVDTYSLNIVQTVFHGNLSIGPMKFMGVFSADNDKEKHSAFVADSFGRVQMVSILKGPHNEGEGLTNLQNDTSHIETSVWGDWLSDSHQIVSITAHGNIVAFLLKNGCMFKLLSHGTTIGEISFVDKLFHSEGLSTLDHVTGGMFLESGYVGNVLNTHEPREMVATGFIMWTNGGSAIIYRISYLDAIFRCELHCEIPATCYPVDVRLSICFLQLNHYLLRFESVCIQSEEPSMWKPHVTIWSLDHFNDHQQCRMIGEGGSFLDWFERSPLLNREVDGGQTKSASLHISTPSLKNVNHVNVDDVNYDYLNKGRTVSSSMVISENLHVPYAVAYGYLSGEIEVIQFDHFQGLYFHDGSPNHEQRSNVCKQHFSGHAGAILCLAAHQMVGNAKGWNFNRVLVSGSMDCTIRIWDLDTGDVIMVMHHHVDPVRQIILSPSSTKRPWCDCFLSVGEDSCIALVSLETLRVERMFTGHPSYPAKVVWDGVRGYITGLCQTNSGMSDATDILYIWDVKTGARERVLRGTAAHSMFDHFCKSISMNSISGTLLNGNTSVSTLPLPINEGGKFSQSSSSSGPPPSTLKVTGMTTSQTPSVKGDSAKPFSFGSSASWRNQHPIKCSCPFPGITTLSFDLAILVCSSQKHEPVEKDNIKQDYVKKQGTDKQSPHDKIVDNSDMGEILTDNTEEHDWIRSFEEYLLRFSLSFLHLWTVDCELDSLLITDMKLKQPENFMVASGMQGDKGSLTLTFPGLSAMLELWKSSSEFCAMRSLTMVSLAQRLISLSHSSSAASSALAAFYTRNFMEKVPDIKPPSLQLLVGFWQDESEQIRMAARSLFHCAASRAIPLPLCSLTATGHENMNSLPRIGEKENGDSRIGSISPKKMCSELMAEKNGSLQVEESRVLEWLESFEVQDWISCVGGTSQDAMTSHIIVAAALAIWYPSLVKQSIAMLVVHPLMKLAMAMNEKYSSTAAELLAEGMESTWKDCIGSEITHLIGDIFFQIELSGPSTNVATQIPAVSAAIRETLVEILLPSLALADIPGFLTIIESQIWSTASDSPVHLVSLMTLIRVVRGSPRNLAQFLDKVVNFILQTIDPSNSVMRKSCFQSSMTTLREIVRAYPMVALNDSWTRLAVGDVIGEMNNVTIWVYDMQSVTKIKVLDASGPPGLPNLLAASSEFMVTAAISALSFSPDGEGLVAFSEHGLMIRWWSLGSVWWEKLSRNFVPVQCTKLIFVPPWEGFSPNSSRSSIMANLMGNDKQFRFQENARDLSHADSMKQLIYSLDLSYRLEWVGERKVLLTRHGHELGTFQL